MNRAAGYQGESIRLPNGQISKHGYGIMRFSTGAVYKGQWKNNRMHGLGEYDWADGNLYIGEFEDGKQHGQGVYTWPTGGKYSGGWENDRMSGFGEYTRADKVRYIGTWKDDVQYGLGRKIVPERIAFGENCICSVERVFEERWGEGKVLLSQREILIHPGHKLYTTTVETGAFCDCIVVGRNETNTVSQDSHSYRYSQVNDARNATHLPSSNHEMRTSKTFGMDGSSPMYFRVTS